MPENDSELWGYAHWNHLANDWSYHEPAFTHDEIIEFRERMIKLYKDMMRYNLEILDYGKLVRLYLENEKFRDKKLLCHTFFIFTAPIWEKFRKASKDLIVIETAHRLKKEAEDV